MMQDVWSPGAAALLWALKSGESEQDVDALEALVYEAVELSDEALREALAALAVAAPRGERSRALSGQSAQREVCERFGEALATLGELSLAERPWAALEAARLLRRHPDLRGRELYAQVAREELEALLAALREDEALEVTTRLGAAALTRPLPMALVSKLALELGGLERDNVSELVVALTERRPGLCEARELVEEDLALLGRAWPIAGEEARAVALQQLRDRIEIERSHLEGQHHRGSAAPALGALDEAQARRFGALLWAMVGPESQQERALVLRLLMVAELPLEPQQALLLLASPNKQARGVALLALRRCATPAAGDGMLALRGRLSAAERAELDALIRRVGRDPEEQVAHAGGLSALGDSGGAGGLSLAGAQAGDLSDVEDEPQVAALMARHGIGALTPLQRGWLSIAPPPRAMSWGLVASVAVLGNNRLQWVITASMALAAATGLVGLSSTQSWAMAGLFMLWLVLLAVQALLGIVLWSSTLVQALRCASALLLPVVHVHKDWRGHMVEVESERGRHVLRVPAEVARGVEPGALMPVMWSHRGTLHSPLQLRGVVIRDDGALTTRPLRGALALLLGTVGLALGAALIGFMALLALL